METWVWFPSADPALWCLDEESTNMLNVKIIPGSKKQRKFKEIH
jgi:hypothetical protein